MFNNIDEVIDYVKRNNSQSHLCICNTDLFDDSVGNGVYGFPHAGGKGTKSFWRSAASLYNIGPKDLIFLYRTAGNAQGCREINGPFKIHEVNNSSAIYYDIDSKDFCMKVNFTSDCTSRFLFEAMLPDYYSIADNYEVIKKFESKEIWGYRHPAVMNIGAARKKSVTSFTCLQTQTILNLMKSHGRSNGRNVTIPAVPRINYYNSLNGNTNHFKLDDNFLLSSKTNDEAYLYAYIMQGLRSGSSLLSNKLITELGTINDPMLMSGCSLRFGDISVNTMMETIISPHLQDELDIVLQDKDDKNMLILEMKEGLIDQAAVIQAERYLDLFKAIFPTKKVFVNLIGSGAATGIAISNQYKSLIKIVSYKKEKSGYLTFQ